MLFSALSCLEYSQLQLQLDKFSEHEIEFIFSLMTNLFTA